MFGLWRQQLARDEITGLILSHALDMHRHRTDELLKSVMNAFSCSAREAARFVTKAGGATSLELENLQSFAVECAQAGYTPGEAASLLTFISASGGLRGATIQELTDLARLLEDTVRALFVETLPNFDPASETQLSPVKAVSSPRSAMAIATANVLRGWYRPVARWGMSRKLIAVNSGYTEEQLEGGKPENVRARLDALTKHLTQSLQSASSP